MALEKLKKWIGTQAMTAFFDQLNDNVDATNEAIDLFEPHLAESAFKHITESGSNENGSYIKFDDGTMICVGKKSLGEIAYTGGATWANPRKTGEFGYTFPSIFASIPEVNIYVSHAALPSDSSLRGVVVSSGQVTLNGVSSIQALGIGLVSGVVVATLQAIGRWK